MKERSWWLLSASVSLVLLVILVMFWSRMNHYDTEPRQMLNQAAADDYLGRNEKRRRARSAIASAPLTRIPTGIFVQSLKFFSSTEVNLSGYIWQRYTDGVNEQFKPRPGSGEVGFVLPEQVDSGSDLDTHEVYRIRDGAEEVIGWYFEATLRQPFDYFLYPFDHKTVWVRMWPRDFAANVVLTPDFSAYGELGAKKIFGMENQIVLGTWEREKTYFDFQLTCYDTNFGIRHFTGQHDFPELYYNIVIKRRSANAFIVYLLPLFLVAALLYSALLTVTGSTEQAERHGFNTSGVLATCAALVFVVLLAHIQLREQFAGSTGVYMEYFYFLMYAVLVAAVVNTYLFSARLSASHGGMRGVIHYRDNLIPKVAFWPVLLLCMNIITGLVLWVDEREQAVASGDCPVLEQVGAVDHRGGGEPLPGSGFLLAQ